MNEISCPHCKKAFKVDKAGYADILKQVRDQQFEEELKVRLSLAEKEKNSAVELAESKIRNTAKDHLSKKEKEMNAILSSKDSEIAQMKSKIENAEIQKELAISEALKATEKQRDSLLNELKSKEIEKQLFEKSLNEKFEAELKTKDNII